MSDEPIITFVTAVNRAGNARSICNVCRETIVDATPTRLWLHAIKHMEDGSAAEHAARMATVESVRDELRTAADYGVYPAEADA